MLDPNQLEEDFSITLVRLLRQFNLLELNLGLAISFLVNSKDPESAYPKLSKISLEKNSIHSAVCVANSYILPDLALIS